MANLERSKTVAQSEGHESMDSRHRENFVKLSASPISQYKGSPVHSNHRSQSHSISSRLAPRDQEMYDLQVQVRQLRQWLRQRVHSREHRSPTQSSNSSSGDEWSHRRRTKSLQGNVHGEPSISVRGERHLHRRNRTPPLGNVGGDAMSRGLCQISRSPSSGYIEDAELPCQFT